MARTIPWITLSAILALALALSGCASPAAPTAAATAAAPAQPTTEPPVGDAPEVTIRGFAFAPATLKIKVGTTVKWTNQDSAGHDVVSDTGAWRDSGILAKGQSFSFTFAQAGSYPYHCGPHPAMKATIEVSE